MGISVVALEPKELKYHYSGFCHDCYVRWKQRHTWRTHLLRDDDCVIKCYVKPSSYCFFVSLP